MTLARPPFLTAGMAASVTSLLSVGVPHTYTWTPQVVGPRDAYARRTITPGVPVLGVRCRYLARSHVRLTDAGYVLVTESPAAGGTLAFIQTLTVFPDDPLAVGDSISDVRDASGAVLLAGPSTVEAALPHAGFGATTLKMFVLRGKTTERAA